MLFVNDIAKIIHGVACEYLGIPNKNIGDAFLIVWKLPQQELDDKYRIINKQSYITNNLADCALISLLKMLIKLYSEDCILRYRTEPQIQRISTDYKVELGFGIHVGLAIEGAIGTEFKIDATYMGKDVELTSYLESMTKQYGCKILFSSQFKSILSKDL